MNLIGSTVEAMALGQYPDPDEMVKGPGVVGGMVYVAIAVLVIAAMWRIYAKAGKPGWASIVPIYNLVVWLQIVNRPIWWLVLLLIPIVSFIVVIVLTNDLSKSFGKGVGFTIGLLFLPFIFFPILGFGGDEYVGRPPS